MLIDKQRNLIRWIIIISSLIIVSLILWNTYTFFQKLKADQRDIMENWVLAQTEFIQSQNLDQDLGDLSFKIFTSDNDIPMIRVGQDGNINVRNLDRERVATDSIYRSKLITNYSKENEPIELSFQGKVYDTIYYGNSPLINKLKYYPVALLLIIFLFAAVIYFYYNTTKASEQNKLWAGMAKETAHQIGTPLSSLIGWTTILRDSEVNQEYVNEMEKDVTRLQMITERFSKIGSKPALINQDIVQATKKAMEYLQARSSKLITFEMELPNASIPVQLNEPLYAWTIENIVKNGIDAMKGKGAISLVLKEEENRIKVHITDTGKGIPKSKFKKVFEPGHTTKKRGWGLGLSLAKRIVQEYHNGRIKVLKSEIDKGTTFEISLRKIG